MNEAGFQPRRAVRTYRQTIEANPDKVFPLLCPVREADWLDGWDYEMIYSVSGLAELGAVFITSNPGEEDTVWIITLYDPAAHRVEFARFTPRSRACLLTIAVSALNERRSHVDISYSYTSTASGGDKFIDSWSESAFLEAVMFWEQSMNYFLKTGRKLPRASAHGA